MNVSHKNIRQSKRNNKKKVFLVEQISIQRDRERFWGQQLLSQLLLKTVSSFQCNTLQSVHKISGKAKGTTTKLLLKTVGSFHSQLGSPACPNWLDKLLNTFRIFKSVHKMRAASSALRALLVLRMLESPRTLRQGSSNGCKNPEWPKHICSGFSWPRSLGGSQEQVC